MQCATIYFVYLVHGLAFARLNVAFARLNVAFDRLNVKVNFAVYVG